MVAPARRIFAVTTTTVAGLVGLLAACAPGHRVGTVSPTQPGPSYSQQFDQLWARFDALYPSFDYKGVDWDAQRVKYRPRAEAARTQAELVSVAAEMLEPLKDLHIWFVDKRGQVLPTFRPSYVGNFDRTRWRRALRHTDYVQRSADIGEATIGGYGYLFLGSWRDGVSIGALDLSMARLRDVPGLIIDVRTNGGGSDATALDFASRFTGRAFTASYVQVRNGPSHEDLDVMTARTIGPRGPWQYTRPVVIISGRGGFSATESFIAAMKTLPNVTVIGDTTGGASGNPALFALGGGWSYSVPQWIEYGPDRQPIEWRGVAPHVFMPWMPSSYDRDRDPLIDAAVGMLAERNGLFHVAPAGTGEEPPATPPATPPLSPPSDSLAQPTPRGVPEVASGGFSTLQSSMGRRR